MLSAKASPYVPGRLDFDMVITEGGFKGRRIFPTLPDPTAKPWALNAAKKLSDALGVEQLSGEDVIAYFNRAATNGHARFRAPVTIDEYVDKTGVTQRKSNINFFGIMPAA